MKRQEMMVTCMPGRPFRRGERITIGSSEVHVVLSPMPRGILVVRSRDLTLAERFEFGIPRFFAELRTYVEKLRAMIGA